MSNKLLENTLKYSKEYSKVVICPACKKEVKQGEMMFAMNMCKHCYITLLKMRSGQ